MLCCCNCCLTGLGLSSSSCRLHLWKSSNEGVCSRGVVDHSKLDQGKSRRLQPAGCTSAFDINNGSAAVCDSTMIV